MPVWGFGGLDFEGLRRRGRVFVMAHAVVQGMGLGGGLCVAAVGGSAVQSLKETAATASSFSSFSGLRVSKQAEQPQQLTPASGAGASFPGSLCIRAVAAVNTFPRIPLFLRFCSVVLCHC